MTPHPVIERPRVPVRRLPDGRHRAECRHCDWTLTSSTTTKAEIELDVAYHRNRHRTGQIEVTR